MQEIYPDLICDPSALNLVHLLETAGHEVWFVGGCVRDALMGITPHDFDLASTSSWQDIRASLNTLGISSFEQGVRFGTLGVCLHGRVYEITTTRRESSSLDFRHPAKLEFGVPLEDDLQRRDFSINAMAWNPQRGLVDLFGGQQDLEQGLLRAVGTPELRFNEDALRILRALRFAACLGFEIEAETKAAIKDCAFLLSQVSGERIKAELDRMICGKDLKRVVLDLAPVVFEVLPELKDSYRFNQHNPYHCYDVLEHSLVVCESLPPISLLRWAGLLHDMGKPKSFYQDSNGRGHFPKHNEKAVCMLQGLGKRLRFSSKEKRCVQALIQYHDEQFELTYAGALEAYRCMESNETWLNYLCELKYADEAGKRPGYSTRAESSQKLWELFVQAKEEGLPFDLKDMSVTGHDVLEFTELRGREISRVLTKLQREIFEGNVSPNREDLLRALKEFH